MSQIKIPLPDSYNKCPPAYLNMLMYLRTDADEGWIYSNNTADIKRELKNSGARYCIRSDTLIFPNETAYVNWLIKWSE